MNNQINSDVLHTIVFRRKESDMCKVIVMFFAFMQMQSNVLIHAHTAENDPIILLWSANYVFADTGHI